jgi:signal peptidase II
LNPRKGVDAAAVPPRRRPAWRVIIILAAIAAVVVAIDQITKAIVVSVMVEGEPIHVWDNIVILDFVRNPGAAFSLASGSTWIFSLLAAGVTVVIIWLARRLRSVGWGVAFGLLLGGTLGNLSDRLVREPGFGTGWVIDFINLPWLMPAIFNVADIGITSSVVVLVLLVLTGRNVDGTRGSREKASRNS